VYKEGLQLAHRLLAQCTNCSSNGICRPWNRLWTLLWEAAHSARPALRSAGTTLVSTRGAWDDRGPTRGRRVEQRRIDEEEFWSPHRRAAMPLLTVRARACSRKTLKRGILIVEVSQMPTITIELPEGALSALRLSPAEFAKEMRIAAALLWYSHGDISQSKAADIAGTSRAEFIDELAHRRIPVVQATIEDLQDEIRRE
jgi:predicted HTH domain antitoxin